MASKRSAAEAMSDKMFRRDFLMKKKGIIIAVIVFLIAVGVFLIVNKIRRDDKMLLAQNLISQFEINTTYRSPELAPSEDNDGDGVINSEETRAGTNPLDMDSDNDGLSDKYEIWIGTNPNNPDTDGDTLLDGFEMIMKLDPRKDKSNGTDSDDTVKIDYKKLEGQLELNVTGNANIADVSIIEMNLFGISSNAGVVSRAYDLASSYKFDSATITFRLDFRALEKDAVNIDSLSVLRFDKETQKYEKFKTKINKFAGSLSANITQYGTYVIGSEKMANAKPLTRIAFLLDNSGSMYPYEVSKYPAENDVNFQRLDFTKALIEKISGEGDYQYSIAKFTGSYTLLQGFTKDTEKLKEALRKIRNNDEIFDGSHIETALEKCMGSFEDQGSANTRNIVVLLSDGASDEKNAKTIEQLAAIADKENIRIMTVGLGKEADRRWLQKISADTGGKYYSASDADALENVHKQIVTTLNYDIIDYSDEGEEIMGYSLYNTGFDPKKNGFSFKNFRTSDTPSLDFGMALMARDWYVGRIGINHMGIEPRDPSGQKYDAPGYDFENTNVKELFDDNRPLCELRPSMLRGQFADVRQYLDYGSFGSTLKIKSSLRKSAEQQGWKVGTYRLDAKNLAWNSVELLSLDLVGSPDKINVAGKNDEYQLFSALYMMNAVQWDDKGAEFDLYKGDDGFAKLKRLLAVGEPVLTMIDGSHTVNAIGLIQDSTDHRKFVLTVYDSNYPGAQKKIYITRSVITDLKKGIRSFVVSRLYYKYTCVYEGKQVGVTFSDIAL
ncbi:MAG: VWA domain-containing protein [Ruminococcus sp.]|nr:VWA domain-containing protein [Ruminococcus sp.]